jgi:hypothetical protein
VVSTLAAAMAIAIVVVGNLVIPLLLLVLLKLIPWTRSKHALNYGICGVIAVVSVVVFSTNHRLAAASALLLAALFIAGYMRATRESAEA